MNFKSLINDICCDGRIKNGIFDIKNANHVFILQEYLEKSGYDVNYVVDKTANLFEAGRFPERQAYNKDGILVTFPSKEYRDRAVNKGTHFAENPKKSNSNLFTTLPADIKAGDTTDSIYATDTEKQADVSVDQELANKTVATQKDKRTPSEKQLDSKGVEAILIGQTPLVNYSVDEAIKYGFYKKGMLWYDSEGNLIGEQVFNEQHGSIITINESLLSNVVNTIKKSWNKVKSYFKNTVKGLIDNGMSDLKIGEETDIVIPASIAKEKSGMESPNTFQNEGAIEAIRGNYNEALTVKYVIEKNEQAIQIVLTETLNESTIFTVVKLDETGKRYVPEVDAVVKDWDDKLKKAAGSKYEEVRSVISLASNDMSSYIINSVGRNNGNILQIFLDNKSFLQGAEFKADIRLKVRKSSGKEEIEAYSLKMYQTKQVNLANTTKNSLIKHLCGDEEAAKFMQELQRDPKFVQMDRAAKDANLDVKRAKEEGEDEDYVNMLRDDREEARKPVNQYLADAVANKLKSFFHSSKENQEIFIKNLLKVMGFEDTETKFLMALVGPKQVKAQKSQIIDKHPSLDFSNIDIIHEPGSVGVKIVNKKTNKVLVNFVAKEAGTFAGFVDVLA
jgi:hypothetical protein